MRIHNGGVALLEETQAGIELVTSTGISSGSRVLRRMALCVFSDVSMESDGNDGLPRETADSESGRTLAGKSCQSIMLDHRKAAGTRFRGRFPVRH